MNTNENSQQEDYAIEDYDTPKIEGELDTVEEGIEYLEKKVKIPVWIWLILIVGVSFLAFYLTSNQSPTLIINK